MASSGPTRVAVTAVRWLFRASRAMNATPARVAFRRFTRNPLVRIAASQYLFQFGHYVLPFVTLPYLARALSPTELGAVFFAQSLALVLTALLNYGFDYTGVRDIARNRNPEAVSVVAANVLGARVLLAIAVIVLGGICSLTFPILRAEPLLGPLAVGMAIAQGMNPRWVFFGLEKPGATSLLDFTFRALAVAAIIMLGVRTSTGVLWVWTVCAAVPLLLTGFLVYREIDFRMPTSSGAVAALRSGFTMFLSNITASFRTTTNVLILALMVPTAVVPNFAGPERLVRAASRLATPLTVTVFPRMSSLLGRGNIAKARQLALITLLTATTGAVLVSLLIIVLAPVLVPALLGGYYDQATPTLRVLALTLPLVAAGQVLSTQFLLANGYDHLYLRLVAIVSASNVAMMLVMVPELGVLGAAWSLVAAEVLAVTCYTTAICRLQLVRRSTGSVPPASDGGT